jgi:type VI secretion system secreted protein Hcp
LLKQTTIFLVLIAGFAFLSFHPADAAFDMYLKIGDIKGESTDKVHKDEIDVLAWSWGLSNTGTIIGGGGGAGKANVQDISLVKYIDLSTTDLMKGVLEGKHFPDATITVRKSGDKPIDVVKYVLKDILVTSVSSGGSGGEDRPTESVTLNFAKIESHYTRLKPDGKCEEVSFGWDIAQNVQFSPTNSGLCTSVPPVIDADGDGIPDELDTDVSNPSNQFSDNGSPVPTTGTIISFGDQSLSFQDLPSPQGVKISATGGSNPAEISWCDGLHARLGSGNTVNLSCGSSIIQVESGPVDISYTDGEGNSIDSTLVTDQDFEFDSSTFTLSSNAGTAELTLTTSDGKIVTITIPEGNSVTIDVDTLVFTTPSSNDSQVNLELDGKQTSLDPNSQADIDQIYVDAQFRQHLSKQMIKQFNGQIKNWNHIIGGLEKIIPIFESQADRAEAKGNLDKAQKLRDQAADKQDKIEITQDLVSVLQVSIDSTSSPQKIPVDLQDNLLSKSVKAIDHRIAMWDSKIVKLNKRADDLDKKAGDYDQQALDKHLKGKTKQIDELKKKAAELREQAESLRAKALVYSDLAQVLRVAIDSQAQSASIPVDEENDTDENDSMLQ